MSSARIVDVDILSEGGHQLMVPSWRTGPRFAPAPSASPYLLCVAIISDVTECRTNECHNG
jgi:hypothetical protein